jgi:hypothetical protein
MHCWLLNLDNNGQSFIYVVAVKQLKRKVASLCVQAKAFQLQIRRGVGLRSSGGGGCDRQSDF